MKRIDVLDLPEDARDLVRECEAKGTRTLFERNGRPVAVLVSHDEYLALRETIEIANDSLLFARLASADEETQGSAGVPPAGTPAVRNLERIVLSSMAGESLEELAGVTRRRALSSLARINLDPICGAPLFEPLKGLWSYRTEELRIIYKIRAEARMVVILSIDRLRL